MITVDNVISALPRGRGDELPAPPYEPTGFGPNVGLCVPSMARHTSDEGWQLFLALKEAGYELCGLNLHSRFENQAFGETWTVESLTNVGEVTRFFPQTLVLQDKREWEGRTAGPGFDPRESFTNVDVLKDRRDVFKLTILKDAQHNPVYHRQSADEIGCHAWIVYYHPRIVKYLAPYVREQHLVRTYHTIDKEIVPQYTDQGRHKKALLSGAISGAYPLRQRIYKATLANVDTRLHPGYGRKGCDTPNYLKTLSHYRVAICTSSRYGYALRKIIEATACGCRVITDLPVDDVMPVIDGNLYRINPDMPMSQIVSVIDGLSKTYDPLTQYEWAEAAKAFYDYRVMGKKLANDIEKMRREYNGT